MIILRDVTGLRIRINQHLREPTESHQRRLEKGCPDIQDQPRPRDYYRHPKKPTTPRYALSVTHEPSHSPRSPIYHPTPTPSPDVDFPQSRRPGTEVEEAPERLGNRT